MNHLDAIRVPWLDHIQQIVKREVSEFLPVVNHLDATHVPWLITHSSLSQRMFQNCQLPDVITN